MTNMRIASFDIGKKNFSFCVEDVDLTSLQSLQSELQQIDQSIRYLPNGTLHETMVSLFNKLFQTGQTILFQNIDLTKDCKAGTFDNQLIYNMINMLEEHRHIFDTVSYFVIEQQMSFGKARNPTALKLSHALQGYLATIYSKTKPASSIVEYPSYHKTQVLGCQKVEKPGKKKTKFVSISKPLRKKWSVNKAKEIFTLRNDTHHLQLVSKTKKADDLSDTLIQLQAFKYQTFVEK
jgi:hypothetical protein